MPKIPFPVVGTFNKVKQAGINPEQTYNMYLINENDPKTPDALINVPGYLEKATFTRAKAGRTQGLFPYQTFGFAVVSQYVYKITNTLQPILIGTLTTDSGPVQMAGNNNNQLMIVDGANGYIYNTVSNTFQTITDVNFLGSPSSVAFLDGRFIINTFNSNEFQLSAENDGLTWIDPNNTPLIGALETAADTIQAVAVNNRQLYLFGTQVTEVWNDAGNPGFPFARLDTMLYQYGTIALGSVVQGMDMLFFLGSSAQGTTSVFMSQGGQANVISSTDVEQEINNYSKKTIQSADAYMFRENGYTFYAINFTASNSNEVDSSWLYNFTNDTWSKQKLADGSRHPICAHLSFNERNYCLSYNDNKLYELSQEYTNFNGENIVKERITHRFVTPTLQDTQIAYVTVDCAPGFGTNTGTSASPEVWLSWSKNGGINYSKSMRASIGAMGKYNTQAYFHNLGISDSGAWVFKFQNFDDIPFFMRDMSLWVEVVGP
jgi:hypothetical protein